MIIAIIFFIHIIFALIIFTKKWQIESISAAFLNIGLIAILFSVGWSIAGIITKLFIEPKGLGTFFDRDTITLTILTAAEYFFYKIYYNDFTEAGKEKQ